MRSEGSSSTSDSGPLGIETEKSAPKMFYVDATAAAGRSERGSEGPMKVLVGGDLVSTRYRRGEVKLQ